MRSQGYLLLLHLGLIYSFSVIFCRKGLQNEVNFFRSLLVRIDKQFKFVGIELEIICPCPLKYSIYINPFKIVLHHLNRILLSQGECYLGMGIYPILACSICSSA